MKFDSSMVLVLLAAFAPVLVLFLAIVWDRRQRKHTEKLLRPPGCSLSISLENTFDSSFPVKMFSQRRKPTEPMQKTLRSAKSQRN